MHEVFTPVKRNRKVDSDDVTVDCFYDLCEETDYKVCGRTVTCGKFKNRGDAVFVNLFMIMWTSLLIAVIGPLVLYDIADQEINQQVVIDSTSAVNYDAWQNNVEGDGATLDIGYDVFFFDIQNPEGILAGEKPVVAEVGPYAFNEYYQKFDIEWSDDGNIVTHNTYKYYVFDKDRTRPGLSLDDKLTLPYVSVLAFQTILEGIPVEATEFLEHAVFEKLTDAEASIDYYIEEIENMVDEKKTIPKKIKEQLETQLEDTKKNMDLLMEEIITFTNQSDPADLLLKTLMCNTPSGVSPFWSTDPVSGWFGWFKDPLMKEVQVIIDKINAKSDAPPILWSSAIPGAAINYTSIEDTRRRRGKDSFKTGKKRSTEVGQYVKYQNMSTLWVCVMPTNSQDPTKYEEGVEFPACELWNGDWTDEEAVKKGYTKPFANDYSNRIEGTDATMFGRPIRNDLAQVFISDIYRSAYLRRADIVDWYGVKAHRFEIQLKDMDNSTTNPENAAYFQHAPAGLENMTQATGAPIFASFPHFLYGQRDLVADIKGIDPREEIHTCYLDVEPQTGLLVGAKKRLQLAYLIESKTYPEAPKALDTEAAVCANLTNIVSTLHSLGLAENITIDCNLEVLTELLTCWQQPSTWTINSFREEGLYMPYGWVEEKLTLPESDATDLNDSLFAVDDLASDCRKLSLMIAGLCFASMLAMLLNRFYTKKYVEERIVELSRSKLLDNKYHSGDRNIRVDTNSEWSEPLMSPPNPLWEKKHASEDAADHKDDASYHFSG